ncbi:hypothetical protein LXL04_016430 [Taraxacum kok-saghyz]
MLPVEMQSPFLEFMGPTTYVSLDLLSTGVTIPEHSIASSVNRAVVCCGDVDCLDVSLPPGWCSACKNTSDVLHPIAGCTRAYLKDCFRLLELSSQLDDAPVSEEGLGLQFAKCLYEYGLGFSPLPPVLTQGSDPSVLWLSYNVIAVAIRSAINASRALVTKTSDVMNIFINYVLNSPVYPDPISEILVFALFILQVQCM